MTESDDQQARPEPPLDGNETQTLIGFLEYQRATFAWKTSGLDTQQLDQTVGTSTITLGGMIKHLAYVEDDWFGRWLFDEPRREPWASVDGLFRPTALIQFEFPRLGSRPVAFGVRWRGFFGPHRR